MKCLGEMVTKDGGEFSLRETSALFILLRQSRGWEEKNKQRVVIHSRRPAEDP
jgi:hypothetical protein